MQKILELSMVQDGYYPEPTGATEITYTGGQVWVQGTFGDNISIEVDGLTASSFKDPLTKLEYTYSRLNTRNEYQIAGILELDEFSYNNSFKTYAGENIAVTKIVGNYNGQVASVKKGTKTFVLAVPTIISGDINLTRIEDLVFQNKLIYNGFKNLPSNYKDSLDFNPTGETILKLVNESNLVVFSGSTDDLSDENKQIELIENLQLAYNSTDIENNENISNILEYNTSSNPEGTKYIAQTIINKNINKKIEITAENTPNPVYLANTCLEMNTQQVGALNTFFNGSGYNGDANYWCGLSIINAYNKGLTGTIVPEIGNLKQLTQINLSNNAITGKIPNEFNNLTNIVNFTLQNTGIDSLEGLIGITNTPYNGIKVNLNQLTSLNGLNNLVSTDGLYIQDNPLVDISALSNLKYITNDFYLTNLGLNDSNALALSNLTNITRIYAGGNNFTNVDFLSNLTGAINTISLRGNNLNNINGLSGKDVLNLSLYDNPNLVDYSGISHIKHFEYLHMRNNGMTNLDFLSGLETIGNTNANDGVFSVDNNPQLTDLSGINNLVCNDNDLCALYIENRTFTTKLDSTSDICTNYRTKWKILMGSYTPESDDSKKSKICNP